MQPVELFRYCPRCGQQRPTENVGQTPLQCGHCGLVFHFNPTVAAGACVFDPMGRILFIRRAKEPSAGLLGVPGGFIDFDESAEDGLRREVREEVGLELAHLRFLVSFPNRYPYREVVYPVVDLYFTATAVNPEQARPLDAVAGLEWRWPGEVTSAELAFDSLRGAIQVLRRCSPD
jgi:ADP-ribose pyrophosphatase YjhB (NUDIX family)